MTTRHRHSRAHISSRVAGSVDLDQVTQSTDSLPVQEKTEARPSRREWRARLRTMTSLREVRATRLLSIRELARQASVAPSTIYLIESGRSNPRLPIIRRIAGALQVEATQVDEFRRAIEMIKESSSREHPSPASPD
jgi:DNA-binding XRE family transcriptional regulator